ncbi:hypothetical protein PIGHUM_03659 [Pigmentiphaga humi]|uniref:Uncharacterized protein n=1 Tax=Pigmentiphaga humi TaxID=2478468 RepID=A0A3P4B5J1_9BURK|nr:hypothetical protein [Pigmentiphaga humi]VCU71574.1 hypothetical protein PIGHUM_03659 [Pigmentiphaga humi]
MCYYREYPMGWGTIRTEGAPPAEDAPYVDDPPANFADEDFWRWVASHTDWSLLGGSANPLANSYAQADPMVWRTRGLPAYMELAQAGQGDGGPALRFAVRARRAASALATTDARGPRIGTGRLAFASPLPGGEMAAVAAAETYYRRPDARADGRVELPSLFMPYWQARLSPVAPAERGLAWARQGAGQ